MKVNNTLKHNVLICMMSKTQIHLFKKRTSFIFLTASKVLQYFSYSILKSSTFYFVTERNVSVVIKFSIET